LSAPTLFRVVLPVPDLEAAAAFYARVLGAGGERVSPGRHYFACGATILACYDPVADGDDPAAGWSFHSHQYLYFLVEDPAATLALVEAAGGAIDSAIEEMPWGERLFYARDPFGSRIAFVAAGTAFRGGRTA